VSETDQISNVNRDSKQNATWKRGRCFTLVHRALGRASDTA